MIELFPGIKNVIFYEDKFFLKSPLTQSYRNRVTRDFKKDGINVSYMPFPVLLLKG